MPTDTQVDQQISRPTLVFSEPQRALGAKVHSVPNSIQNTQQDQVYLKTAKRQQEAMMTSKRQSV